DSYNYGAVVHIANMVSLYYNYAQSVRLSAGFGVAGLLARTAPGVGQGDGSEHGLRGSLLGGIIESNWTYYANTVLKQGATPGIPTAARNELDAIFDAEINQSGGDHMDTDTSGFEFETIGNVTKNWRLIWNMSTNELAVTNR